MPLSRIGTNSITDFAIGATDLANNSIETYASNSGVSLTNRNRIINGDMRIAQRGTSNTSFTLGYALDRMYLDQFSATGNTHTYQQLSSDPPVGFSNYLRWQRNSGETATGAMRIYYTGETSNSDGIAGNKLTLSFYARAGADYSGGSLESRIVTGEGTDESRSSWANGTWTNQVNDSQNNTLTTSWQRFTHTLASACGNDVSQHALRFVWTPTGTASTNDYIEITGVQLEVGSVATPFERRPYGTELSLCQRYACSSFPSGTAWGQNAGTTGAFSYIVLVGGTSAGFGVSMPFPVQMRAAPTLTYYNPSAANDKWRNTIANADSASGAGVNIRAWGTQITNYQVAGDVASQTCQVHWSATSEL